MIGFTINSDKFQIIFLICTNRIRRFPRFLVHRFFFLSKIVITLKSTLLGISCQYDCDGENNAAGR